MTGTMTAELIRQANRMDRRDVESRHGLHTGEPRLRPLLRAHPRRTVPGDAGKSYRPWAKDYTDPGHPAAVKDSPLRTTCKECRRIAKTFPVRRTEAA